MPFRGHVQTQVSAKLENDLMEHTTGMWGRGHQGERERAAQETHLFLEQMLLLYCLSINMFYTCSF